MYLRGSTRRGPGIVLGAWCGQVGRAVHRLWARRGRYRVQVGSHCFCRRVGDACEFESTHLVEVVGLVRELLVLPTYHFTPRRAAGIDT